MENVPQGADAAEAAELERQLIQARDALANAYMALGREIYEQAERQIAEITLLSDHLIELKERLRLARGEWTCPRCLSPNPIASRYCGRCGNPAGGSPAAGNPVAGNPTTGRPSTTE